MVPLELTADEVEQLHQRIRAYKSPQAQVVHAQIILQAFEHPESSNQQIAMQVCKLENLPHAFS